MIEKNFDPDSDHCPEKEMVEHLYKSKQEIIHCKAKENREDENFNPAKYSYSEITIKK